MGTVHRFPIAADALADGSFQTAEEGPDEPGMGQAGQVCGTRSLLSFFHLALSFVWLVGISSLRALMICPGCCT